MPLQLDKTQQPSNMLSTKRVRKSPLTTSLKTMMKMMTRAPKMRREPKLTKRLVMKNMLTRSAHMSIWSMRTLIGLKPALHLSSNLYLQDSRPSSHKTASTAAHAQEKDNSKLPSSNTLTSSTIHRIWLVLPSKTRYRSSSVTSLATC